MPEAASACPIGFVTGSPGQCVPTCPTSSGLENRLIGGEARCVYTQDSTQFFALQQVPPVLLTSLTDPQPTLSWVQQFRPSVYSSYTAAQADATTKTATLLATIGRSQRLTDAFQALQTAEGVRDTSPQAYQTARNNYYTLKLGPTWAQTERQRVLNAEVLPNVVSYVQSINTISERQAQQSSTKTAVDAVKSKLLSLKDDFRQTTGTLSKQVTELRNQIEIEKRRGMVQVTQTSEWFINLLLVILSLVVIVMLVRRILARQARGPSTYTSSTYRR
jgi:hypothetical protein